MPTTILIPARGGSVRVPRKGLKKVGGKTLIQRAVETVSDALERVPVTAGAWFVSDDLEMLEMSKARHVDHVQLPDDIAGGENGVPELCQWFARRYAGPDHVCIAVQPTSPFVSADDLVSVIRAMEYRSMPIESVVSVTVDGKGYRRNGAIYATLGKHWLSGLCVAGPTLFHVMPPERSIDIDTVDDLREARRIAGDSCIECGQDEYSCGIRHISGQPKLSLQRCDGCGVEVRRLDGRTTFVFDGDGPPVACLCWDCGGHLADCSELPVCHFGNCTKQATCRVRKDDSEPVLRCAEHGVYFATRDQPWTHISRLDGE